MSLRYSELHKGKLFLSNRDQIKVSDVFDEINKADDENVLLNIYHKEGLEEDTLYLDYDKKFKV